MIERCGDRQRKFDGLEKWRFHLFIDSLPIMLQIALLLLASGLSKYMLSVNTSVGNVVLSFTVLGGFFFTGIVVAGITSHECPFQTPASTALQHLVETTWKSLRSLLRPIRTIQHGSRLRVDVQNLERIRRQNMDDPRCVSWVLRNITDPEVIDSAIRLAGAIRWFDGDSDYNKLFDLISSTLKECFNSTKQLYPGMRNRAYFSSRAILQIQMKARAQSPEHAFEYPIPTISSSTFEHTDPDLHHIIHMFECNSRPGKPTLNFPMEGPNSPAHSLWMSNLFVDVTLACPNPILASWQSYLSAATANHQAMIANTLLLWYAFLGGHIEDGTIWAVDKSYAVIFSLFYSFSPLKIVCASGSLETILFHLSQRVMNVIADGNCLEPLDFLMEFLAAWEERPVSSTLMAYQWCSTISKAAGKLRLDGEELVQPFQMRTLKRDQHLSKLIEESFSKVGPSCNLAGPSPPQDLSPDSYVTLLHTSLEIGFRRVAPGRNWPTLRLNHTPHNKWLFETAFSSTDDEVLADAAAVWILSDCPPPGSCARYLAKRVEMAKSFSPRLRQVAAHVIESIWRSELEVSESETVGLLNRLDVDMEDMRGKLEWAELLVDVIRSPTGPEGLSPHYWRLLDKLVSTTDFRATFVPRDVEVMKSLGEVEDSKRLEIWTIVVWLSQSFGIQVSKSMEDAEQETLKLFLQQPSVIPRFEALARRVMYHDIKLGQLCDQAQAESLPSEAPISPTVRSRPS